MYKPKNKSLTPALQLFKLQLCAICKGNGKIRHGKITWDFEARPSPLSRTYKIRLCYKQNEPPSTFVLAPDLNMLAEGRDLPHVYSEKPVKLCLYYPKLREWAPHKFIAETIVPWTYLWLLYFEEWLISNEWKGGGKHPEKGKNNAI